MYVHGLHIDGFGIFRDVSVAELPPGMAVFIGGNECGKSTLTEFFRFVLFGPPADDERKQYPPFEGGHHGGWLDVTLQDGPRLTIRRSHGEIQVRGADGAPSAVEPSRSFLGEFDRSIFERVFAIGQEDLRDTRIVHELGVGSRLFATRTGPGEHLLPGVLQRLEQQTAAILKPGGRAHEVGQLQDSLGRLQQELVVLRRQAGEFALIEQQRLDLQQEVERHGLRIQQISRQLERVEQLQGARRHWVELKQHRETARRLEHARGFPPSGLRRFDTLQIEIDDANVLADERREHLEQIERQRAGIAVDHRLLDAGPAIEQLLGERDSLASALNELPAARAICEQRQEEYLRRLHDLGSDWDGSRLAAFDTSVQARQRANRFARQLDEAHTAVRTARRQVQSWQSELDTATTEQARARLRFERFPPPTERDVEIVEARIAAMAAMRPLLHEREFLRKRDQARQAAREDLDAQLSGVMSQLAVGGGSLPAWFVISAALTGGGFAAVAAVAGARLAAGGFLLIAAAVTASLVLLRRRQRAEQADRGRQLLSLQQRLVGKQQQLAQEETDLGHALESVTAKLRETASAVGMGELADLAELERAAVQSKKQLEDLTGWIAAQQQLETARDHAESVTAEEIAARQKEQEAEEVLRRQSEQWRRWLAERGGPAITGPEEFGLVLEAAERARRARQLDEEAQQWLTQIEDRVAYIRRQLGAVLQLCGRDDATESEEVTLIDELSGELARAIEQNQEYCRLDRRREELEVELGRLRRQLAQKQESRLRLLAAAGVDDEEAFRRAADEFRLWQHSKLAADEDEITLRTLAGSQAAWSQLTQELDRTTPAELADQRAQLAAELQQQQAHLAAAEKDIRAAEAELQQMAGDDRLGQKLQEQATLQGRLDEAVRSWSVRFLCRQLLDTARETSERERQPQVMRRAGEYLEIMTSGRYRFVGSWGEAEIVLENADLVRKEENAWSSGSADQACLAIRLGLARELARHTEPLPVVLDDVLARFDRERQRDAVRTLLGFAAEQQVILFSCRDDVAQLVRHVHQQDNLNQVAVAYYDVAGGTIRPRTTMEAAVPAQKGMKI